MSILLPEPDPKVIARRGAIVSDLIALAGEEAVISDEDGRRTFETDALTAYRRVPLAVLDVKSRDGAGIYKHALVLSRPDQHVAWRGNACPEDAPALIDTIRGA